MLPAAPPVSGPAASESAPAEPVFHLAPEVRPAPGGPAELPAAGPAAVPALAGLVTPAAAWAGPGPFRLLRRLFPGTEGRLDWAAVWGRLLRSPCVGGAVMAVAALEVLRRRRRAARRAPAAVELPEVTGPAGL
jgi:hypothetical protein